MGPKSLDDDRNSSYSRLGPLSQMLASMTTMTMNYLDKSPWWLGKANKKCGTDATVPEAKENRLQIWSPW